MPQIGVAIAFGVGAGMLALVFVWVARSARMDRVSLDRITARAYRIRLLWFVSLLLVAILALTFTLPHLPYTFARLPRLSAKGEPTLVQVVGFQYGWQIDRQIIPGREPIRFEVTSRDVNHNFGIYDRKGRLVGQVQAMPGYTNSLVMRFEQPGAYTVRCLELCGMLHHSMVGAFCVGSCPTS